MKKLSVVLCLVLLLSACSKKDKSNPGTEAAPTTLTLDSAFALPGDPLKIKLNRKITQSEIIVNLGALQTKAYAGSDSEYVFFLPVLMPGKTALSIPSIKNSNSLTLTVRDYAVIADPQIVINEFVVKRNSCIDSLVKNMAGSSYQTSPQTALIISQLKEEWDDQFAKLQVNDKLLLAYILKKMMPQPSDFSFTLRSSNHLLFKGQGLGDAGDRLVESAKKFVTLEIACLVQIPIFVVSLYSLILVPNPFSALVVAGSLITFIILREAVIRQAQYVGSLPGILEGITNASVNRLMSNEFYNNTEKMIALDVLLRNLKPSDQTIQPDITKVFTAENELQIKDQEVEKLYTKATQYTSKLKAPYNPYAATIGTYPQVSSTAKVDGNEIVIKGVSDNRINYSSSLSNGNRMIKVSSAATQEINFNISVAAKRPLDGTEFTKSILCVFKPEIDSSEHYKASIVGNWRIDSYDPSGVLYYVQHKTLAADGSVYIRINKPVGGPEEVFNPPKYQESWGVVKDNTGYHLTINGAIYPYVLSLPVTFINGGWPPYPMYVYSKE